MAPPGLLDTEAEGVDLLFDYGSYALYRISTAGLTGLASETRAQVRVVDEMDKILLDAYSFNTQTDTLDLPSTLRVDQPGGPLLFLVTTHPLRQTRGKSRSVIARSPSTSSG